LKGVTKAVKEPRKFVLAAMDFLRTRRFAAALPFAETANSYRV